MKVNLFLLMIFILWSCGQDPIPVPEASNLIAPANLNECNTATILNELESQVKFEWTSALSTDSYELIIENSLDNIKLSKKTSLLTESVILARGKPYRWYVNSISLLSTEVSKSQVWQFYLEGNSEETYFPFPAVLREPKNESILVLDAFGTVTFQWEGHDLDQDIDRFDFYIGRTNVDLVKEKEGLKVEQITINLQPGNIYFWQVVTFDKVNNASRSQIFSFQTLE